MDRTKRIYFSEETEALDVRDKAKEAEDKAKGRKKDMKSLFQSKTSLKNKAGLLSAKEEEAEIKSTGARNDYILSLASANAHQTRFYKYDLQVERETNRLFPADIYEDSRISLVLIPLYILIDFVMNFFIFFIGLKISLADDTRAN